MSEKIWNELSEEKKSFLRWYYDSINKAIKTERSLCVIDKEHESNEETLKTILAVSEYFFGKENLIGE